ncbi:2,3-bisphosphoglycerate-independent phosphoglycerate mutase [bacterium]|nr:2,3-bisphosphoglycerate-independent phosphoglycerate mutase [bacterium]
MSTGPRPVVLIIRDGWAIGDPDDPSNAIAAAHTPNIDRFKSAYPHTRLGCAGEDVGLPAGSQGSSEVGHLNMGAGRIVEQEQVRVDKLIRSGKFFDEPRLLAAMEQAKKPGAALHLMGLLQDQGVHAIDRHLFALLEMAAKNGVTDVFVHAFTDGRDTPPRSALTYIEKTNAKMRETGVGKFASVMGRYFAMDRDKNWERVEKAYRALVAGEGRTATSAEDAVKAAYARADDALAAAEAKGKEPGLVETDEFIAPTIIDSGSGAHPIRAGDAVIFFNYRQDRAIELTRAFCDDPFDGFDRGAKPDVLFVGLTRYYDAFENYVLPPMNMARITGEVLSEAGVWQLRISETQKFAHVTSFFNSKGQKAWPGEERILIDSPKVPENEMPELRAREIADFVVHAVTHGIASVREAARRAEGTHLYPQTGYDETPERLAGTYDAIVINFVNGDMVGHTGDFPAVVRAIEAVDQAVGRVCDAVLARGGAALVTADHGNADRMRDPVTGKVQTSHTLNDVEFILVCDAMRGARLVPRGVLADIGVTMLELLGVPKPDEMTAHSLIVSARA